MRPPWRAIRHYLFVGCAAVSLLFCLGFSGLLIYQANHSLVHTYATARSLDSYSTTIRQREIEFQFVHLLPSPKQVLIITRYPGHALGNGSTAQPLPNPTTAQLAKGITDVEWTKLLASMRQFNFLGLHWLSMPDISAGHPGGTTYYGWFYRLSVPEPFLIALFGLLPMYCVYRRVRFGPYHGRVKSGFCAKCGYDLRASKERCPECGTAVPTLSLSKTG